MSLCIVGSVMYIHMYVVCSYCLVFKHRAWPLRQKNRQANKRTQCNTDKKSRKQCKTYKYPVILHVLPLQHKFQSVVGQHCIKAR